MSSPPAKVDVGCGDVHATSLIKQKYGEADLRAEPSATSAEKLSGRTCPRAVWSESDNNVSSQRWKQGSTRGTIDPGVVVRRSRFETTALEMPAGFGRIHHRANLARNGWPGPHLRTGDVTLVFTTD